MPPMSRRLGAAAAAVCALLMAAACSSPPARSSIPVPVDRAEPEESDPVLDAASSTTVPHTTQADPPTEGPDAIVGLIAAAGPTGLRILRSDGEVVAEIASDQVVTQPTWSRDGRRLAFTLIDPSSGTAQVAVIDTATWVMATAVARRPYFFYSWSHDGSRVAALGPGSSSTTALDILDGTGMLASTATLQSRGLYVAWEPGGRRLLLHAGSQLVLVGDPDSPGEHEDLGTVGADFQAPAWIPGTRDFLYVDSGSQAFNGFARPEADGPDNPAGPQLLRRSADSGEIANLGPVNGFALIAVHPEGGRAALSLPPPQLPFVPDPLDGLGDPQPSASLVQTGTRGAEAQSDRGSVELVDLATGERITVLGQQGHWLEWSPDGRRLLMAGINLADQGGPSLSWHVWDGEQTGEMARFAPTAGFLQRYLPFADQYTETPRLWSPDGAAITFGALIDEGARSAIARLDGTGRVTSLGQADVSFWSPGAKSTPAPR